MRCTHTDVGSRKGSRQGQRDEAMRGHSHMAAIHKPRRDGTGETQATKTLILDLQPPDCEKTKRSW